MNDHPISRLGFVSNPDVEAILVETETLDAASFCLDGETLEVFGKNGRVTARGNPGLYCLKFLKGRSNVRIAQLTLSPNRAYQVIPRRMNAAQA